MKKFKGIRPNDGKNKHKLTEDEYQEYLENNSVPEDSSMRSKISENLNDVAFCFDEPPEDLEDYATAIELSVLGWNFALLDEAERDQAMKDFIEHLKNEDYEFDAILLILDFVQEVITRKQQFFPDDFRAIVDYTIKAKKNTFTVNLVGALP